MQRVIKIEDYNAIIIIGDFNLHHPLWNPQNYTIHDTQTDELVELMVDYGLQLILPSGIIIYPREGTAIDLVWGNEKAENAIVKCTILEENDHVSDHLAIETILNLQTSIITSVEMSFNYVKMN